MLDSWFANAASVSTRSSAAQLFWHFLCAATQSRRTTTRRGFALPVRYVLLYILSCTMCAACRVVNIEVSAWCQIRIGTCDTKTPALASRGCAMRSVGSIECGTQRRHHTRSENAAHTKKQLFRPADAQTYLQPRSSLHEEIQLWNARVMFV